MIITPTHLLIPWTNIGEFGPSNKAAADISYFCPTKDMVMNEIYPNYKKWLTAVNLGKWYHKWDCDNFAMAFKTFADGYYFNTIESDAEGIAIGIIHYIAEKRAEDGISGPHAGNLLYLDEAGSLKPMYFEPQNGRMYPLSQTELRSVFFLYV